MQQTSCRTDLIADRPASIDAFGPHSRVARSLAQIIKEKQGARTIAVEGGWGCGKSTIIELLKSTLSKDPNYSVLVFDAWSHEGDPLRRSFIESLFEKLLPWIDKEKDKEAWRDRMLELSKRRKRCRKRTVSRLSSWGKALALVLFLLPLGLLLVNAELTAEQTYPKWYRLIPGVIFILCTPLLLLLAEWRGRAAEGWSLLVKSQLVDVDTETIETPDPTSVEFGRLFDELLTVALQDEVRELVLVIDNLDRVDPYDARAVWSTLQPFLQNDGRRGASWANRVWFIIPYDPDGIKRIWERKEKETDGIAQPFLEKTFDIRYEVPQPVLSRWREYLVSLLKEALPEHPEDDFHQVYRVFDLKGRQQTKHPSPRDLKLFVNQIGTIHQQWDHEYPLSDVAYFVLLRKDHEDIPFLLLKGDVPEENLRGVLSNRVKENLAALSFNVDVRTGVQLLLTREIEMALSTRQADQLTEWADYDGFWEVTEKVLEDKPTEWARESPEKLLNTARCLELSKVLEKSEHSSTHSVLRGLRAGALRLEAWQALNGDTGDGIISLCSILKDAEVAEHLVDTLRETNFGSSEESNVKIEPWVDTALTVIRGLQKLRFAKKLLEPRINVPATARDYLSVCKYLAEKNPEGQLWRSFAPTVEPKELADAFVSVVKLGKFIEVGREVVAVISEAEVKVPWELVVAQITSRFEAPSQLTGEQIVAELGFLWDIRREDGSANEAIQRLVASGWLHHYLHAVTNTKFDINAQAWLTFTILNEQPQMPSPPGVGDSSAGYGELKSLVKKHLEDIPRSLNKLVLTYECGTWYSRVLETKSPALPLCIACLKGIAAAKENVTEVFQPKLVWRFWAKLRDGFGKDFPNLLSVLAKDTELIQEVLSSEFNAENATSYSELLHAGAIQDLNFVKWCASGLEEIGKERWSSELRNEGPVLGLLLQLVQTKARPSLGQAYLDALHELARDLAAGGKKLGRVSDRWVSVFVPLDEQSRKALRSKLRNVAIEHGAEVSEEFFDLFGEELQDREILQVEHALVSKFLAPLVDSHNRRGLRWTNELVNRAPDILDSYPMHEVKDFRERVRRAAQDTEKQTAPELHELANTLGLRIDE